MKKTILLCIGIIILGVSSWGYRYYSGHKQAQWNEVHAYVDGFYSVFGKPLEEWDNRINIYNANVDQLFLNYRFYYGEYKSNTLKRIEKAGNNRVIAEVEINAVRHSSESVRYTDHLTLLKVDKGFKLEQFTSSSKEYWPNLP